MPKYKGDAYLRLSYTADRSVESDSIANQKKLIEDFVAAHPDIELVSERVDDGYSGVLFDRPAFQEMMNDIISGKINCVIVKDLSRLGREYIETGRYLRQVFPAYGVRFISINDGIDTANEQNGDDLHISLKNLLNEAYAADISKKVRAQQNQAMRDGAFVGGRPPYGYKKDPDNCHHLLVNEDTAPIVRQIFHWMVDGVALNAIVKRLNEGGVMTPGYYLAQIGLITSKSLMGSGKWQTRTVGGILSDAVYTGDMVQGKRTNIGHKRVSTKPQDWIVVHDTHEAIISRELFAKAQAVREQTARLAKTRAPKVPYTENILRGRIFCARCGGHLKRHRDRQGQYYFICTAQERIGKDACSGRISVKEDVLFRIIVTIIRQKAEVVMGEALRLKQYDGKIAAQKAQVDGEISELQQQTVKNKALLASLYENFIKGILTRAEYLEMQKDYSRKISDAVDRVQQLQTRQSELERQMERYTSMADKLAAVDKDTALSTLLVNQLIERVTVNGPDNVSINFAFESGFERVMEVLGNE